MIQCHFLDKSKSKPFVNGDVRSQLATLQITAQPMLISLELVLILSDDSPSLQYGVLTPLQCPSPGYLDESQGYSKTSIPYHPSTRPFASPPVVSSTTSTSTPVNLTLR